MPELSERTKMILKLVALLGVTALIGFGMYSLFLKRAPTIAPPPTTGGGTETPGVGGLPSGSGSSGGFSGTPTPGGEEGGGGLPTSPVAQGGRTSVITLTTSEVGEPTVTANGTIAYYDPADGRFYTIDKNGNVTALADAQFPEATAITFSPSATEAVVEFPDGSNVVYDFATSKQVTLPSHWEDFSFSSTGEQIASKSIARDPSARALIVSSADGTSTSVVAALGANDSKVDVNWSPDGSVLGFSATGESSSTFGQNEVYLIGPDGEASGLLLTNGTNFSAIWSPDSSHLLYSVADASQDYRATLWYADKDGDRKGDARKSIPLQTLAEKCTFSTNSVAYCAAPTTMPAGGGTSPSIITANDNLYRIDLPSGRVTLIAIPGVSTQMFNLSVTPNQDILYYTDSSGLLNYMRLR